MTVRDLAHHLAAALGEPHRGAEIEARLGGLPAPNAAFAERILAIATTVDGVLALHLDDLVLAHHAVAGHAAAVATVRALLDDLRAPLRRTGADAQQIDELLADLPGELLAPRAAAPPRLLGYAGSGPLGGWLRTVAVRTLVARRRAADPIQREDDAIAALEAPDDPELALLRKTCAAEFRAAFVHAVSTLTPEDRLLLRQHHVDGLGIDRLAVLYGCHRATVARRLAATRTAVFDTVRRRLLAELRIGGQTFHSLLRLVRSELDLSIHRYL